MTLVLTRDELDRLFPFHIVSGPDGCIRRVGRALQRRLGDQFISSPCLDLVSLQRPRSVGSFAQLQASRSLLVVTVPALEGLRLKGVVLVSGDQTFLLLTPIIDKTHLMSTGQLRFDDFSEIDCALDVVLMAELQRNSLAEAETLISELQIARTAAEAADRAKTKFLADVSHEIRNPLNGILGMAELMAGRADVPVEFRTNIELIRSCGRTLETLLSDLLDLSSANAGRLRILPTVFSLESEVRAAFALSERTAIEKGLFFQVEQDVPGSGLVIGDAVRLRQILSNLAGNAVKFTERGGISVNVTYRESLLTVDVSDTGPGIESGATDLIFGRFQQANDRISQLHGGSGLGLAICQELASLMGGDLSVESEVGAGSRFRLSLPLKCAAATGHQQAESADQLSADIGPLSGSILIVDDQEHNREVARQMLAGICGKITLARSGEAAISEWRNATFALILMDRRMPQLDGLAATRRIRTLEVELGRPRTPIFILSADASQDDRSEALAAGADGHCAKPIRPGELVRLALGYLSRPARS